MKNNLVGSCGISCGLCPRFQSKSKSQCLGCGLDGHCSYCSIFRCSSMKRNYETCADCNEFPCPKFDKWFEGDSFVTHQKCLLNIQEIKKLGIKKFLEKQEERKNILETILKKYNTRKSMSFYCLTAALLPTKSLIIAMEEIENSKEENKAEVFKKKIQELAEKENVILMLRKL